MNWSENGFISEIQGDGRGFEMEAGLVGFEWIFIINGK
jgi:hypothetical protein